MKEKIKSWMKDGRGYVYGIGLLFASLCAVAFGGAYLGANVAIDNHEVVVNLLTAEDDSEEDTTK